jgi:hypothetical protein
MKHLAPSVCENAANNEILLETIVSAHYLVLQMRMLVAADDFSGNVETELMADALSRWAQIASSKWRDGKPEVGRIPHFQQ